MKYYEQLLDVRNEWIDEMNEELNKGEIAEAKSIAGDIKQNLEKINHHGQCASSIVKAVLEHSQTGEGKKELADINALCDENLRLA